MDGVWMFRWSPREVLAQGRAPEDGTPWTLSAWMQGGGLCMDVETVDDPKVAAATGSGGGASGCGFSNRAGDPSFSGNGYILTATTSSGDDAFIIFAPAPYRATRVRISQHQTVPTHRFRDPLFGRIAYWYYAYPKGGPSTAPAGKIVVDLWSTTLTCTAN